MFLFPYTQYPLTARNLFVLVQILSITVKTIAGPVRLEKRASTTTTNIWPYQTFVSSDFDSPRLRIEKSGADLADGLILITQGIESYTNIGSKELAAPIIMTDSGVLVWGHSSEIPAPSTNLIVQTYKDKPVLSYWSGTGSDVGHGYGSVTILDTTYKTIQTICPKLNLTTSDGSSYDCYADLHESYITERNTILITAVNITTTDLRPIGGSENGYVYDSMFYEIDIASGKILFSWSSVDAGIPITSTKIALNGTGSLENPFDWFHINAIQLVGTDYLINSRHCWTSYLLNSNGHVKWRLDGKTGGDFQIPADGHFAWQHHARMQNVTSTDAVLHYFDNNNAEFANGTAPTKGLELYLSFTNYTATVIRSLEDMEDILYTDSQGSYTTLSNGNVLLGYGSIAKIKEYGPNGNSDVRMTLQFGDDNLVQSYRAYRQTWSAIPYYPPVLVVKSNVAYFSWNGATDVTQWTIYAGSSKDSLCKVGTVKNHGFETSSPIPASAKYVQVSAYDGCTFLRSSAIETI